MGLNLSQQTSQIDNHDLLNRFVYVLSEQSKYLGEISVVRLNEKPYDYYLVYRQMAIESQATNQSILHKKQIYKALQNTRCMVRVEATTIKQSVQLCSTSVQFNSYCRYHNYTLQNAIQCKKNKGKNFRQADLLYIITSLIGVGTKINSVLGKGYLGIFKPYKIYLSTEGYIKVYPFQLLTIGKIKPSQSNEQTNSNYSSVKQLQLSQAVKLPYQNSKIRYEKDDIKDLANLIIQLIFLQKKQQTNNQLQFMLNKKKISQSFKRLLLNIVGGTKNYTFQMLSQQIQCIKQESNIRASYSIRLQQDLSLSSSEIMKQQPQEMMNQQKPQQLQRLASFQKNLIPSKINLLYKHNSS